MGWNYQLVFFWKFHVCGTKNAFLGLSVGHMNMYPSLKLTAKASENGKQPV